MWKRTGSGLVKILVVLVIAAVFFSLLLPAANSSRSDLQGNKQYGVTGKLSESRVEQRTINDAYASPNASSMAANQFSNSERIRLGQSSEHASVNRKIIYVADMSVVVVDVDSAEQRILTLVKELGGYIAEATVNRAQGQQLSGRWKVRIPDDQFDVFLAKVSELGVVESRNQTTQDITEEYIDIEAQVANKKKLEERITALLEKTADKISDVIAVEHELGRIRGEIERLEGRIKYLTNQTSMTTISITLREESEYEPESPPTFSERIGEVWNNSLTSLGLFGERLLLATVAASPWIVVASVILVPGYWVVAKRMNK
jgi:hypothetical protein